MDHNGTILNDVIKKFTRMVSVRYVLVLTKGVNTTQKEGKKWVDGIYDLYPKIRPPNECELDELISTTLDEGDRRYEYEQKQIAVEKWLEKNSSKIDYKIGKELEEILRK